MTFRRMALVALAIWASSPIISAQVVPGSPFTGGGGGSFNGGTITGVLQVPAGTIAANGVGIGAANTGFYVRSGVVLEGVVAGTSYIGIDSAKVAINSAEQFAWSSGSLTSNGSDTGFARYSAGVIRSTNASTGITGLIGGGAAVASASALPVPTGNVFHVTGTTNITSITATNFQSGVVITLIFDGVLTFTDGNNLKLAGNMTTAADATITLAYDGTNFYEVARSTN